jgi:methyl-accepting chemotaxis protein
MAWFKKDSAAKSSIAGDSHSGNAVSAASDLLIKSALEECKTNVMIADENYNIVYMNKTMIEMMQAAEADLRKDIPALDSKRLIGSCIDIFHKNPAHQRRILDSLNSQIETDITVGGRSFHLVVTPVRGPNGKRAGTVVEWKDETDQKALERTNLRIRTGLDLCTTNVMVADEGFNIIYMNNTLTQMLKEAESEIRKVLPSFDSSRLIGQNMDVFHKDPSHQRRMVGGLTGVHRANISVGTQKFALIATAIFDAKKNRVGTVVEWKNETAEKAIEEEIEGVVKAAVAGDFSKKIPAAGKQGFMLNLATSMNAICENTETALEDLANMLGALSQGDLTRRIEAEYHGMFGTLKDSANTTAERLSETVAGIKSAAREVANASAEISTSTTDLSQRTEEQAAGLEETSASMEQIAATVKKNAENAQEANKLTAGTRDVADRGGQVVANAVEAMSRIEESSRKIADIIGVIDEIARQTNLLALNAAVEAARAGDAGRGFAVVASEVRSLAQRSSQAAKDIKDLITNSNSQVKDGVDLVNRAGKALGEIVESIKNVAGIVADIANASNEQATGIEQVNKALTQMDEVTQQNSALVEENAATAKTLEQQSTAMDERVGFFQIDEAAMSARIASTPARPAAAAPARSAPPAKARPAPSKSNGAARRGPVGRMQAALATAVKDDPEWQEF